MHNYSFFSYTKEAELPGGDYWKFLDSTPEILKENSVYLYDIKDILNGITNNELKAKMKEKILNLIMESSIDDLGANNCLDIFSKDELKQIIEHEYEINVDKFIKKPDKIKYNYGNFTNLMNYSRNIDEEYNYSITMRILDNFKDFEDKSILVSLIEYNKKKENIYNKIIKEYYNYLPIEYKNYLETEQNPYYMQEKSSKFMDIDIGIDPKISIGPEIEANNDYSYRINPRNQKGFENFVQTTDATVPNGDEIAPHIPFHNTKEEVAKFCGLCETMKDLGYYYNEVSGNASGQINLGLDYLDTKEAILNFYEIYGNCEELLYYISSEEGQLFRQDVYCSSRIKPISEIIGKRSLDEELTRSDVIKLFNSKYSYSSDKAFKGLEYKKNSVCLRGNYSEDFRLEFRIPNGGCNYKTWIDNIRLYGKMLEVSKKLADIMKKEYLTEEDEKLLKHKIDLQNNNLSFEEKLVILMNLLFKEDEIKQIYYDRYKSTIKRIKETNSTKYNKKYSSREPSFNEIEFIDQYHSRFDSDYDGNSIEYDPDTDTIKRK